MEKCIKYLYCFNSLSAKKIEILIIIFSLIGTLFTIIDIAVIHWKYTKKVMKVFYIFSLIFLLLLILFSSFFIYIRKKHNIQLLDKGSKLNKICIIICYIELFLCVFSIFIQIFVAIGGLPDLHNYNNRKDMNTYNPNNPDESGTLLVSNSEFSFAIISIIINIFIWIENLLLCLSYIIRIKFGINGSYRRYLNEQRNDDTFPKEIIESQHNIVYPIFKKEEVIHSIICPMRHTSDDVSFEEMNLWIVDERLAYHRFLASDKTIKSLPAVNSLSTKELDIAVFDRAFAYSEDVDPLNTITIIEFKKPEIGRAHV